MGLDQGDANEMHLSAADVASARTERRVAGPLFLLLAGALGLGAVAALTSWWLGVAPAAAQSVTGEIVDFEIRAPSVVVRSGTTVTFTNNGARPHTVTDRGGLFDTNPIQPGETGSFVADVPGTYAVFCRINPARMNATIKVEPAGEPTAVRIQAFDEQREGAAKAFDPPQLEVTAGTRVVLANVGGLPHSLRAVDDSFRIPVIEPGAEQGRFAGGSGSTIVTTPGTHAFFCEIHPAAMKGTLVVKPPPGGDANKAPPTSAPVVETTTVTPASTAGLMIDFDFTPTEIVVQPGATVVWTNGGKAPHTATFDDVKIDTGRVEAGASASLVAPAKPGTYSYFCTIHPKMRGALRVAAPLVASVPAPPKPSDSGGGTVVAYALAALFVGTGAGGLALGLRRRHEDPTSG